MAENIEIPKTPMSRTEQYLTKIVKELSGSKEDVEIPKAALSRVEYYLQAIVNLLAEVALGETFTADEKKKLASITNPINVQGTCTQEELEEKTETAQVGDMWFVKNEGDDKSKEYVYTGQDTFDLVGDNSINLEDYVKETDIATQGTVGLVQADDPKQSGLTIDNEGKISIYHPDATDITQENISESHTALTLDRVQPVMSYYGLTNKDTLNNDYVKQTQIATTTDATSNENRKGLVNLGDPFENGLTTEGGGSEHLLKISMCDEKKCKAETDKRLALHPNNIPMFMNNWGLSDKKWCHEIKKQTRKDVTTNSDGIVTPGFGSIVLAAYASTQIQNRSVCLIPIYGAGGAYTSFLAIDYVAGERLKTTPIGDVTFYYITAITTAEQTNSSSPESETPPFETEELTPQSDVVTESVLEPSIDHQPQHVPFHTEVETTEVVDPLETEDIQDGEIDG